MQEYQYIAYLYMGQLNSRVKQGSSELIILALLSQRDMHGYEIGKQIDELSNGVLRFEMASLYIALYRMLRKGWVQAYWETSPAGRRRRYYRLTKSGRLKLTPLRRSWQEFFGALNRIARVTNA
jgi:transcriptional regulator